MVSTKAIMRLMPNNGTYSRRRKEPKQLVKPQENLFTSIFLLILVRDAENPTQGYLGFTM